MVNLPFTVRSSSPPPAGAVGGYQARPVPPDGRELRPDSGDPGGELVQQQPGVHARVTRQAAQPRPGRVRVTADQ